VQTCALPILLQVAEGATSTIGNIVDRMKELAAQAASSNSGDRAGLHAEFETLRQEITRIVDTTQYQGTALLQSVAAQDAVEAVAASTHTAQALASGAGNTGDGSAAATGTYTGAGDTITLTFNGGSWSIDDGGEAEAFVSGDTFAGVAITIVDDGDGWADGDTLTLAVTAAVEAQDAVEASGGARLFLVSSSGDYAGQDLVSMDGLNLTVDTLGIALSDISTQEGAQTALAALDGAVDEINSSLSTIGATQNRI